ncbi:WD domain-containing protein, variant [Blastomyces gilchristii SLH14081]|uniref:WD domain-containing protein n=1 Tax=Blastomyces gilchristii (strain SLH14081) TaxID=559298 RepID=A0A179UCS9_BLAGS|nr:WD domain-containing protein [Blastomyces gilchristii SLH14081]XP_031576891.1 WD domain-containing protein, variant [Blastomyces gilchristii SLH14081]OAT05795.1 WD domain-containing protein [Blastomyces gilchristii SLH14081]OAT05796.1 WD domain-containing protein, variant [Blastomyces gilchristii SLH14081]
MTITYAEQAYREALKTFEENLNSQQLRDVQRPTSLTELCKTAASINAKHASNDDRKTIRFTQRVSKVLGVLQPFDGILSSVAGAEPFGGANLIWSSIRFTFQLVEDAQSIFDSVFGFFEDIALELEIIQKEINTFKDSQLVSSVGQQVFAALLDFWVYAVKTYRNLRFGSFSIKSYSIKSKFEQLQSKLQEQTVLLKSAAQAQHHENSSQFWNAFQQSHRENSDQRVFDWLKAPDYATDLKKANSRRHDGTCVWVMTRPEYKLWSASSSDTRFLVIYGIPGAGKTILSSFLVEWARRTFRSGTDHRKPCLTLYHFFKADDETKNTPLAALRSLLEQLYSFVLENNIENLRTTLQNTARKRQVDYEEMLAVFASSIQHSGCTFTIVLDALDECRGVKSLCKDLKALVSHPDIHVVATSRRTGEHVDVISGPKTMTILMTEDDVRRDIASFVRYKVNKMPNLQSPAHRRLKGLVIDELSKKENHKGMFLWAYLMCKDIKMQGSVAKIRQALLRLPSDMVALYLKILEGLNEKPVAEQDFVQRVFQWVVGSIRPLRWCELDQALQIDQFRAATFEDDDDYDEAYIYSRRDVVKACGSLVQYSGLDDGDTIRLIHLSAREFLQRQIAQSIPIPPNLTKYFVEVTTSNAVLATACLNVLHAPSVQNDTYFRTPKSHDIRTELMNMCPLFEYAVLYWPEFACAFAEAVIAGENDFKQPEDLFELLALILDGPWSLCWLEEYIRLGGIDIAMYTVERIQNLDESISRKGCSSSFTPQQWAAHVVHALHTFSETISHSPECIHTCVEAPGRHVSLATGRKPQHLITLGTSTRDLPKKQPLPKGERGWIGYNHKSRSVFLAEKEHETIRVSRRHLDGATAYRPALENGEESYQGTWKVRSAQLKQDATFLAVTFCPHAQEELFYRTVCWSLSSPKQVSVTADWAQVIIVDRCESEIFCAGPVLGRGSLVAFGENNLLITPGGIWDLASEDRLSSPKEIWNPENPELISQTCFSSTRAARVRDRRCLDILEIFGSEKWNAGDLTATFQFSIEERIAESWARIRIRSFSRSGAKLLLTFYENKEPNSDPDSRQELQPRIVCIILDGKGPTTGTQVDFPIHSGTALLECQFTDDEERIVGRLQPPDDDINAGGGISIVVWGLQKKGAKYDESVQYLFLWKSFGDVSFTITPPISAEPKGGILIAFSDGSVARRSVSDIWSSAEEAKLRTSRHALEARGKVLNYITPDGANLFAIFLTGFLGSTPALTVEVWSLTEEQQLSCPVVNRQLEPGLENNSLDSNGRFLLGKSEIFDLSDPASPQPLLFQLSNGGDAKAAFCPNQPIFAYTHAEDGGVILRLYEGKADRSCQLLLTHRIVSEHGLDPQDIKVAFDSSHSPPRVFAYSYWTVIGQNMTFVVTIEEDGDVNPELISEEYMADLTFSVDGKYIFSVDRQVPPEDLQWPTPVPISPLPTTPPTARLSELSLSLSLSILDTHPVTLERDYCFMDPVLIYRISQEERLGTVYLDVKRIHEPATTTNYFRKALGIVPDDYLNRLLDKVFLVWPRGSAEEVKMVVVPGGRNGMPMIIRSGMSSGELVGMVEKAMR